MKTLRVNFASCYKLLIILLLGFIFSACDSKETLSIGELIKVKHELTNKKLNGDVKKLTLKTFNIEGGEVGNCEGISEYHYDIDNNLIEERTYECNKSLSYKYIYTYDDSGRLIESSNDLGGGTSKMIYSYENNGNFVEVDNYLEIGRAPYNIFYKYDENKRMLEYRKMKSDGEVLDIEERYYDAIGNMINKTIYYDIHETELGKHEREYKYNKMGRLIAVEGEKTQASSKSYYEEVYQYNDKGHVISIKNKGDFSTTFIDEYIYDNYDVNDNWLKQTVISERKNSKNSALDYREILRIKIREIVYY